MLETQLTARPSLKLFFFYWLAPQLALYFARLVLKTLLAGYCKAAFMLSIKTKYSIVNIYILFYFNSGISCEKSEEGNKANIVLWRKKAKRQIVYRRKSNTFGNKSTLETAVSFKFPKNHRPHPRNGYWVVTFWIHECFIARRRGVCEKNAMPFVRARCSSRTLTACTTLFRFSEKCVCPLHRPFNAITKDIHIYYEGVT